MKEDRRGRKLRVQEFRRERKRERETREGERRDREATSSGGVDVTGRGTDSHSSVR